MGQYIMSGLCHRLELDISNIKEEKLEEIKKEISEQIDISAYDLTININTLVFTAKENIFMNGFVNYVKQQYLLNGAISRDGEEIIEMVEKISSINEAIEIAQEKKWDNFQIAEGYISVTSGFNRCRGYCSIIALFIEGKASLECYSRLFSYMEELIKKDNEYPCSRFTKVILT